MTIIRPAGLDDIARIVELTDLWAKDPSTTGHYPCNTAEGLRERMGPYLWVAEEDGSVVGFALGETDGDDAMLYQVVERGEPHLSLEQLYVDPGHRRKGIGGALIDRLLAEGQARGITCCILVSQNLDWPAIIGFYARHGFRPWYLAMFTGASTEERRISSAERD